eukprot:GEMP01054379.1.p1 GENE.GEMP01054379.1~~GEMP01054379.1.p1  ORF type:complete len:263 (+),score=41.61 GEMP01054379.1:106-894(+)
MSCEGNSDPHHDYQASLNQQDAIRQEASVDHPLMKKREPVGASLNEQFAENKNFLQKVASIAAKYEFIRRARPDGNCFYRTYLFGLFERLLGMSREERDNFVVFLKNSLDDVLCQGYERFAVEEMHEDILEEFEKLAQNDNATVGYIETIFDEERHYHICYLRCLASAYLKQNAELYQSFLEGYATIAEFCAHEVDPMWREADQLQILALSSYFQIPCSVIYLDQSDRSEVTIHRFPEDLEHVRGVHLLYRPGHYDLLTAKK